MVDNELCEFLQCCYEGQNFKGPIYLLLVYMVDNAY